MEILTQNCQYTMIFTIFRFDNFVIKIIITQTPQYFLKKVYTLHITQYTLESKPNTLTDSL